MLKNNSCLSQVFFIRYMFPLLFFPLAILVEGCSFISDLCSWKSKNNGWTLSSSDKGLYCWLCNIHVHTPFVSTSIQCNGTWMQPQQSKVAYRRIVQHSTIYDLKGAYYFGICRINYYYARCKQCKNILYAYQVRWYYFANTTFNSLLVGDCERKN